MRKSTLLSLGLAAVLSLGAFIGSLADARAADTYQYFKAQPAKAFSWTGIYIKGDLGYSFGDLDLPAVGQSINIEPRGFTAGVGIGFDYHMANNFVIGGVLDTSWLGAARTNSVLGVPVTGDLDYAGTLRANLGYSFGTWMPYATVGYGWGHLRSEIGIVNLTSADFLHGMTYGAGIKLALTQNWAASVEWLRYDFDGTANFGPGSASADAKVDTIKLGLQYRFGG